MALGSGFIIDPSGYIVTNSHVVQNAESITVIFNDNSRDSAKIVGQDRLTDLALLKVDAAKPLPYVSWGDSDTAQVGDWVLAIGNPFGLANTVSYGIISARGRDINAGPYDDFLQIDASINRGDSGGPTFDLEGRVIGVNTAIYSPSGGSVGIGFAIPANLAKPVIDQIRAHGKVVRGWLGVQIQNVTPEIARSLGLANPAGALIADVIEGGPAAKAGFRQGDVILSVNGHDIGKARDLSIMVAEAPVGKPADVELWRDGHRTRLTPVIAEMPRNLPNLGREESQPPGLAPRAPPRVEVLGLQLATLDDQLRERLGLPASVKGVIVLAVASTSPFAEQNIELGDVIQTIDQRPVASPADVAKILDAARARKDHTALMLLNRGGANLYVTLSTTKSDGTGKK